MIFAVITEMHLLLYLIFCSDVFPRPYVNDFEKMHE